QFYCYHRLCLLCYSAIYYITSTTTIFIFFPLFFFKYPPPPDIYTLSLHDALPIWLSTALGRRNHELLDVLQVSERRIAQIEQARSEEHTSELQSHLNLVCRLLLEKKKKKTKEEL